MNKITLSATRTPLFSTIFVVFLLLSTLIPIPVVKADSGWLIGWDYRKQLTITGSNAGIQTNYQIGVVVYFGDGVDGTEIVRGSTFGKVYTDSKCQVGFDDIIFTTGNGITLLDFWIEDQVNSSYALIWIEVDTIPESPSIVNICMYYGNDEATTTSDGDATFIYFNNFTSDPTITLRVLGGDSYYHFFDIPDIDGDNISFDWETQITDSQTHQYGVYGFLGPRNNTLYDAGSRKWQVYGLALACDTGTAPIRNIGHVYYSAQDWSGISMPEDVTHNIENIFDGNDTSILGVYDSDNDLTRLNSEVIDTPFEIIVFQPMGGSYGGVVNTVVHDAVNNRLNFHYQAGNGARIVGWLDTLRIRKWVDSNPEPTSWGSEEEPPVLDPPLKLFGAGFNASSPFVSLYWRSNYTDTDISFFEVQNSTDKITWEYLGQSNTTEYHDFQVVNGTEKYYKIRTCNYTGSAWDNSTFTDIDFEKVYFAPLAICDPEWLSGWDNRVKITIDSGDVDTALTDFPILIYLSDSSGINGENITFVFDEVGANSLKIAVTLNDGTTECYVEVEKWNSGSEKAWLWAKIPSISNIIDTEIYLYYDTDHADNVAHVGLTNSVPAENVWESDFLMVQHQAGDSSPIRDSTSNDIDMTEGGDPTYLQAGPIDGEIDYDGNDYHLSAINVFDAIVGTDKGTMTLWIKTTDSDAVNAMVVLSIEGAYMINFRPGEGGLLKTYWSGTQADAARTTTQINTGAQFYIVSTYDGANQRVYVNGNLEATDACNLWDITGLNRATGLGSHYTGTFNINANIDEVRVSKINRSPSWIKATYETDQDDLLDYGSEERIPLESVDMNPSIIMAIFLILIASALIYGVKRRR